jgi:hypothetical protein
MKRPPEAISVVMGIEGISSGVERRLVLASRISNRKLKDHRIAWRRWHQGYVMPTINMYFMVSSCVSIAPRRLKLQETIAKRPHRRNDALSHASRGG